MDMTPRACTCSGVSRRDDIGSGTVDAGYAIVSNVLSDRETLDLLRSVEDSSITRSRAGARHLMCHAAVHDVAHDQRLLAIARQFVGPSAIPYRATLFDKSPDRNWLVTWHQDTALPLEQRRDVPGWGPWSVKAGTAYAHAPARALCRVIALRLHFDDSGIDNGPLRVIPGSHGLGVLPDAAIDEVARGTTAVDCLATAGGIVAMRPLLLHASTKTESARPRRVLHLEYVDSLEIDEGLRIAIA
jgi:ectoine hydroxylase-related dioxygenase (phytanoyl-CoA dioxygenase family)